MLAIEFVVADLVGAGPGLVPGGIRTMNHLVSLDRIGPGVSRHRTEECLRLGSSCDWPGWLPAAGVDDDGHHPPVGTIGDEAERRPFIDVGLLAGRKVLAHRRQKFPSAKELIAVVGR